MISALSLNAALAVPVALSGERLEADQPMLMGSPFVACKAVNALRTANALGSAGQRLLISIGGETGEKIQRLLGGLPFTSLLRSTPNRRTVVVSQGDHHWEWKDTCHLAEGDLESLVDKVEGRLRSEEMVILSGTPPLLPEGKTWRPLFDAMRRRGSKLLMDSGQWRTLMDQGASVHLLKVNRAEWGSGDLSAADLVSEMQGFRAEHGLEAVIVTAGAEGAWAVSARGAWHVAMGEKPTDNHFIGCGDAFAGGLAVALTSGENLRGALVQGTACAFANLASSLPGEVVASEVMRLRAKVNLQDL